MDQVVLDPAVLQTAIGTRNDLLVGGEEANPMKARRYAAYRQFTQMRYGTLTSGQRVVIPSVTWRIRDQFPDPEGRYVGFLPVSSSLRTINGSPVSIHHEPSVGKAARVG